MRDAENKCECESENVSLDLLEESLEAVEEYVKGFIDKPAHELSPDEARLLVQYAIAGRIHVLVNNTAIVLGAAMTTISRINEVFAMVKGASPERPPEEGEKADLSPEWLIEMLKGVRP